MESTIKCGKHLALHAKLTGSRFEDVCLGEAQFDNVSLAKATLHNVNLSDMNVSCFQMGGARFTTGGSHPKRNQKPISFENCELVGTTFKGCDLSNTSIENCNVEGMTINGIRISELLALKEQKK
jgi:uncharacterized protein YjbI with pentapeptide repeats